LGATNLEVVEGTDFQGLRAFLAAEDNAVIDVGASNLEALLNSMTSFATGISTFDLFVIPVKADATRKALGEGLDTADALSLLGVAANRIRFLPNFIKTDPVSELGDFYAKVRAKKKAWISENAFMHVSDTYEYLARKKLSMAELVNDDTDYKALAREAKKAGDKVKALEYGHRDGWRDQAILLQNNLKIAFDALMEDL